MPTTADTRPNTAAPAETPAETTAKTRFDRDAEQRSQDDGMPERATRPPAKAPTPAAARERGRPPQHQKGYERKVETTDLERRVLAHERILQTLIAHLAETQPAFLDRLHAKFSEPMRMSRHEQNYTDTDSYAEQFVHAVSRLGRTHDLPPPQPRNIPAPPAERPPFVAPVLPGSIAPTGDQTPTAHTTVLRVARHGGIWELKRDGHFYGHYSTEASALTAVLEAARRVVSSGGPAEICYLTSPEAPKADPAYVPPPMRAL